MSFSNSVSVFIADKSHAKYASIICSSMEKSAKVRGTGIAKRSPKYIIQKMENNNAVIALQKGKFAGFCYIETWGGGKFIANSGLIVDPKYRNMGLAKTIKTTIFEYSKNKFPEAKFFGITTGPAVMRINHELGYKPVTFSQLTDDPAFWDGCKSCKNYDILQRTERKMCLCTAMLYDPKEHKDKLKKTHTTRKHITKEYAACV